MTVGVLEVVELLGGRAVLRSEIASELDLVQALEEGLPTAAVRFVVERGILAPHEVDRLIAPRRTLAHRRKHEQALSPEESDRLARVTRVAALALATFHDEEKAWPWLRRPNRALDGAEPLALLRTGAGARLVEDILERIASGVFS